MDCEKCEELLLDELYGELDDVTSAAVRRHVAGCARCSEIFSDLKSTREMVSSFPIIAVPPSLEERIFAAEKESKKVVQLRGFSRFVSVAGRWAMRPQTAMAALFLLMIGSTTFLLKGTRSASHASAPVVVAQEGAPMAADQTTTATSEALGPNAARGAHGPLEPKPQMTPPPALAAASAAPNTTTATVALADVSKDKDGDDSRAALEKNAAGKALAHATKAADPYGGLASLDEERSIGASNAAAPAGAPMPNATTSPNGNGPVAINALAPPPPPAAPAVQARTAQISGAGAGGSALGNANANDNGGYYAKQPAAEAKKEDGAPSDAFTQGTIAFRNGQYPAATQSFDRAASNGDLNASLWAARSTREGQNCQTAIPKFDAVTQRGGVTGIGADALFESAKCSELMGQNDVARAKYTRLLAAPSHAARAQQALDNLNRVATRRANESPAPAKKAAAHAPAAAAAPSPVQAPAQAQQPSATDSKK